MRSRMKNIIYLFLVFYLLFISASKLNAEECVGYPSCNNTSMGALDLNPFLWDSDLYNDDIPLALTDLGSEYYIPNVNGPRYQGGLYPESSNDLPAAHLEEGINRSNYGIEPLCPNGEPPGENTQCNELVCPNGKPPSENNDCNEPAIVLLTAGYSNTSYFSSHWWLHHFYANYEDDYVPLTINRYVRIVNGARSSAGSDQWVCPIDDCQDVGPFVDPNGTPLQDDFIYDDIKKNRLVNGVFEHNYDERQVQIVWLQAARSVDSQSFSLAVDNYKDADAFKILQDAGHIVRALKARYENLKLVFYSGHIYSGYTLVDSFREPFSYENNFTVKWLIDEQIRQDNAGYPVPILKPYPDDTEVFSNLSDQTGDLDFKKRCSHTITQHCNEDTDCGPPNCIDCQSNEVCTAATAPWIAWGPYLWADGINAQIDNGPNGLNWVCSDFTDAPPDYDCAHPSIQGTHKGVVKLEEFFDKKPTTAPWFRPCDKKLVINQNNGAVFPETSADTSECNLHLDPSGCALQSAHDAADENHVLLTRATEFVEDFEIEKSLSIAGAANCAYGDNPDKTHLKGYMHIKSGTVTLSNFRIMPH